MNYLIQQSLLSNTTSRQMIDGIWNTFVPPYARRKWNLKHYLAHTWALVSRPSYASGVLEHLRRLVGLYRELRFRDKFDVSLSPSLERMTIKRRTRDGRSRNYLVSRALLDQEFADGGQVTASHLRNIIGHLDDYV
jgi:hypothetical protein